MSVPPGPAHGRRIPEATVARLPLYLRALVEFAEEGVRTVSSDGLAHAAGMNSANVRKDLSSLGSYGTRGVGYPVEELLARIGEVLGTGQRWRVMLVGAGNLGRALAAYRGFRGRRFEIAALLDADPERVGTTVAGVEVEPVEHLREVVAREGADIAVLAVPGEAAQEVADALVDAGVTAILNFAPAHLEVPDHVNVRPVDLATELQILAYHEQQRRASPGASPGSTDRRG